MTQNVRRDAELASRIVADGGGEIIGRTKIQKIGYFLEVLGAGDGFRFGYKHFGPFSEDLSSALKYARIYDLISEDERRTAWGGFYSVFRTTSQPPAPSDELRAKVINLGKEADPVELELAATAAYLALDGAPDPWRETARRKPDKASAARVNAAKSLYARFRELDDEGRLPLI